jgi:hypothetical protein
MFTKAQREEIRAIARDTVPVRGSQTTIIRDYAMGCLDGFFNDLAAGHVHVEEPVTEDTLIEAYLDWMAGRRTP